MPVTPQASYPGVPAQEIPSGARTIVGVSTSIAAFIGRAKQGPMYEPVLCLNCSDFDSTFSSDHADCDLVRAVRLFFLNGGTQCYVTRIAHGATSSTVTLEDETRSAVLDVTAKSAGIVSDGSAPLLEDYRTAFGVIDKKVDLFNLMVLPGDSVPAGLWGEASTFCQKRRAFLLMDPPVAWDSVQKATDVATGVNSLRVGLVKDYSAIFYPRVSIVENGLSQHVGPSGAIAGLMARIDATRGVWKAPAGTEADVLGIVGLECRFTDDENGTLNSHAVNTLRIFPDGIVNWGARTMAGDDELPASDYKYIPVRRLALYIEESVYRGLKWVVFEPNDEPLWAQIRLNIGAFMHGLFRQGAFQGTNPNDAYFVKCDKETTTQDDVNKGVVNILVGLAPLQPAEFVIIQIQQMAGQIQV